MATRGVNTGKLPKIEWGDGNTELFFGHPLDRALSWSEALRSSGAATYYFLDNRTVGHTQGVAWFLSGRVRYVPTIAGVTQLGDTITGWDDGWEPFLRYCRAGNMFTFFPDADETASFTASLVAPLNIPPTLEEDFTRTFDFIIRSQTEITGY